MAARRRARALDLHGPGRHPGSGAAAIGPTRTSCPAGCGNGSASPSRCPPIPADPRRRTDHRAGRDDPGAGARRPRHAAAGADLGLMLVSHDLAVVSQTCSRLYVMYAGRVVESARPRPARRAPAPVHVRAAALGARPGRAGPSTADHPRAAARPAPSPSPGAPSPPRCPFAVERADGTAAAGGCRRAPTRPVAHQRVRAGRHRRGPARRSRDRGREEPAASRGGRTDRGGTRRRGSGPALHAPRRDRTGCAARGPGGQGGRRRRPLLLARGDARPGRRVRMRQVDAEPVRAGPTPDRRRDPIRRCAAARDRPRHSAGSPRWSSRTRTARSTRG